VYSSFIFSYICVSFKISYSVLKPVRLFSTYITVPRTFPSHLWSAFTDYNSDSRTGLFLRSRILTFYSFMIMVKCVRLF